jgi:Bacterial inner membrane protein
MIEIIGWVATGVFAASYFCKEPAALRRVQAGAALLWIAYGVLLKAPPVIVANVVVAGLAVWSSWRGSASDAA